MIVVGSIEMGAVMGGELHCLHRPALTVRQIFSLEAFKESQHPWQALLVIAVLNHRMDARRIGRHVILQWHGNVDQLSRHGASSGRFDLSVRGIVNATCLLVSSSSAREVTNNTGSHRASVKPPGGLAIRARELATGSYDTRARRGGRWVGWPTGRRSFWTFGQAQRAGAREDLKTYYSLMQTTNRSTVRGASHE